MKIYLKIAAIVLNLALCFPLVLELKSESIEFAGSCKGAGVGLCFNFLTGYSTAKAQRICNSLPGTMKFSLNLCGIENSVGSCVVTSGEQKMESITYYPLWSDTDSLQRCNSLNGLYTAF